MPSMPSLYAIWKHAVIAAVATSWAVGIPGPARVIAGDYGEKFESYPVDAGYKHASPEALDAWRDRKYGMRIVWGVYSRLNVEASWPLTGFRTSDDLPQFRAKYQQLYKEFNPTDFSGEGWAELMQRCGFKYFTFITKHHDGFAMWDTKAKVKKRFIQSGPKAGQIEDCDLHYSIMETPFGRDILKELVDATSSAGYPPGSIFRMRTGTTPTSGWTAGIRIATQATPGKQIRKVGNVLSPVTASRCANCWSTTARWTSSNGICAFPSRLGRTWWKPSRWRGICSRTY